MQGERHYRLSHFTTALDLYERAIAADSALALAAVKGAQAASWGHERDRGRALVELALSREPELPERYRVFARGLQDYLTGAADSAVVRLTAAQELDPEWAEPAAALGEVYHHLLPGAAPLDSLAHAAFAVALENDGGFTSPLFHLTQIHIRQGNLEQADRLLERFRLADPEAKLVRQLSLMRDCVRSNATMDWTALGPVSAIGTFEAAKALAVGGLRHACAEGAFRAVLRSPTATGGERWGAFLGLQGLLVARGADVEARELIDSVVGAGRGIARTLYVLDVAAGAAMQESANELDMFARSRFGGRYETLRGPEALWVLTVWHQHRGDPERIWMLADALSARAGETGISRDSMFAAAASAHATLARGDTGQAIERLRRLRPPTVDADLSWRFGDALPPERLLLARLLLATGQYRETLLAASVFDHPQPIMFVPYVAASLVIRYEAAIALGDNAAANRYRQRLLNLNRQDLVSEVDHNTGGD
jgi:Tfp pilus assembly protein PilF